MEPMYADDQRLSAEQAAIIVDLEVAIIHYYAEAGLIAPTQGYGASELAELRRVRRLIVDLDLDAVAVEVLLRMRQRLVTLQAQVTRLEAELRAARQRRLRGWVDLHPDDWT